MIILETLISAGFSILCYFSYIFWTKTTSRSPSNDIHKEHQLVHLFFSGAIIASSVVLSALYFACASVPIFFPKALHLIETLFIIKEIFLIFFTGTVGVIIKHIIDEETPSHKFFYRTSDEGGVERRKND